MYSHDRTLLAKLGFSDPDKKNPEHDQASRYLSEPAQRDELIKLTGTRPPEPEIDIAATIARGGNGPAVRKAVSDIQARCEYAISKGEGQYRTTIGFVDLAIILGEELRYASEFDFKHRRGYRTPVGVGVEVKVAQASWAEALRQINLYREYLSGFEWILAVRYDVTEQYVMALADEGVRTIRLGNKFEQWRATAEDRAVKVQEV